MKTWGSVEKQPETIGDNSSYEARGPACTMEGKSEAFRVNGSLHLDSNRTDRTSGPHHFQHFQHFRRFGTDKNLSN